MMKRTVALFLLVSLFAIGFLFPPDSSGEETMKIGIIAAQSAALSRLPADVLDGFRLGADKINSGHGVQGMRIVPVTRAAKAGLGSGLATAQALVAEDKVDILVASTDRANALVLADFAAQVKIPLFVAFSERPVTGGRDGNRYVFTMSESPRMAGAAAAVMLHEKPYEHYWIAGDDDDYGHALADALWGALKKLEPTFVLVGQSWWKAGERDFAPYIAQIISTKPDFVVVATGPSNIARFQRAAKAAGLAGKIPFYQHWANEHSILAEQGNDAVEGVYGTASYLFYNPSTPANKAFSDEFRKTFHRYPGSGAFYGYMTARFIAEGFRKAGKVDREKLISALEGMSLESPVGHVAIRPCDHQLELPIFLSLTGKNPAYPDFLTSVSLQSLGAKYYMPGCEEGPKTGKR
ncbi:MAG: ABC transporter substrate-binding protein [Syntrophorhabdales bacterium]